jgi:hypothetical protein
MPKRERSYVPWLIAHSDVNPVGDPELQRHLQGELQVGMVVHGQFDEAMVLGLVALRCKRVGGEWVPESICVPETPIVMPDPKPALDVTLLSGPHRHRIDDEGILR